MYADFKILLTGALLVLTTSLLAQCPTSLNNINGLGALTLFFASGETPSNLASIDVNFPGISGNFAVMQLEDVYQTTSTAFSGITLTGAVTLRYTNGSTETCDYENGNLFNPLPVELADFSGQLKQNNIQLYWKTSSEQDNAGFEMQRSFDGEHFDPIGLVDGFGTSNIEQTYSFIDTGVRSRALGSIAYYRLAQLDYDGQKNYSEVLAIDLELAFKNFEITKITGWDSGERFIRVYFYSPHDVRKVNILLTDISGRTIDQRSLYPTEGLNTFEIDLSDEASPFFFLSMNNGKAIIGKKIALASDY